jgi:hypothetical protein
MMLQKDINQRARVTIQTPFLAAFLRFLESAIAALLQGEKMRRTIKADDRPAI